MLSLQAVEGKVTVTCLVRHPPLYAQPLMDFVHIRQNSEYVSKKKKKGGGGGDLSPAGKF